MAGPGRTPKWYALAHLVVPLMAVTMLALVLYVMWWPAIIKCIDAIRAATS